MVSYLTKAREYRHRQGLLRVCVWEGAGSGHTDMSWSVVSQTSDPASVRTFPVIMRQENSILESPLVQADASVCLLNSYLILSSSAAGEKPLRTPIPRTPQPLLVVPVSVWHHALPLGRNEAQWWWRRRGCRPESPVLHLRRFLQCLLAFFRSIIHVE